MKRRRFLRLGCLASALFAGGSSAAVLSPAEPARVAPGPKPASLAGSYDGHEPEIAARLELRPDGRFRYALSYGALDEEAAGRWDFDGSRVLLTSDPLVPPKFALIAARPTRVHRLKLTLDLPQGMERQYFMARLSLSDGRSIERQLGDDGLVLPLGPSERLRSVALTLPVYELEGEPVPLPRASGGDVRFRFEPNDLGKVAFEREPLLIKPGGLQLSRHGRTILFTRFAVR